MDTWIIYTIGWLLMGVVLLLTRLRCDRGFGGWILMLSDSRHGTARLCIVILVILAVVPPLHLLIRGR